MRIKGYDKNIITIGEKTKMENINEHGFNPSLALNEFEHSDGVIYQITQTTPRKEIINLDVLKGMFEKISHVRGNNRVALIENTANAFILWLKENKNKEFSREHLNLFVAGSKANKNKVTNAFIDFLLNNKIIEKVRQKKTFYYFANVDLKSSEPTKRKGSVAFSNVSVERQKFKTEKEFYLIC